MNGVTIRAIAAAAVLGGILCPAFAGDGIHIEGGKTVNNMWNVNDGKASRWDIYLQYGTVQHGTNYLFSNGMFLYLNGQNFQANSQTGRLSEDGREVEVGVFTRGSVRISRRIRVYPDQGLARWIDIYENTGGSDQTLPVQMRMQFNYGIQSVQNVDGKKGTKAVIVSVPQHNNSPNALWYFWDEKADLNPQPRNNGGYLNSQFQLTVPAGKTVAVLSFVAQSQNMDELKEFVHKARVAKLVDDISPALRKIIVNFNVSTGLLDLELERIDRADMAKLHTGEPMFGRVANESFRLETDTGPITLESSKIVGMISGGRGSDSFRVAMVDGQILRGRLPEQVLRLDIPAAGVQEIPLGDIGQWSFRVDKKRPEEIPFAGPYLITRSGDRLAFDPKGLELRLQTRCGSVDLPLESLHRVVLDNPEMALHRVQFLNGSMLAGVLEPSELKVTLRNGQTPAVPRSSLLSIEFAAEDAASDLPLTQLLLTNGDHLLGRLVGKAIAVKGKYAKMEISPDHIRSIQPLPGPGGWLRLVLWNETVLDGRLTNPKLSFQVAPGPIVPVRVEQVVGMIRPDAMPPNDVLAEAEKQIALLAAESYKDRQAAVDALKGMGKQIVPILRKHLANNDPEVRRSIEEIIKAIGPAESTGNTAPNPAVPFVLNGRMIQFGG